MSKFKYVAIFLTREGAEHYEKLQRAIGYEVKVLKQESPFTGNIQYVVYQTREKVR
jgi:hypothetical protein